MFLASRSAIVQQIAVSDAMPHSASTESDSVPRTSGTNVLIPSWSWPSVTRRTDYLVLWFFGFRADTIAASSHSAQFSDHAQVD